MLGGTPQEWSETDSALAVAFQEMEDGLCPCGCGYPRDLAWDPMMEGWFESEEVVCQARAARERFESGRGDRKSDPGTLLVTRNTDPESGGFTG